MVARAVYRNVVEGWSDDLAEYLDRLEEGDLGGPGPLD